MYWRRTREGQFEPFPTSEDSAVRCEPTPFSPGTVICNETQEPRCVITDFFGRNKRETSTIPKECLAKLCRKHYQERQYRNNSSGSKSEDDTRNGEFAAIRCLYIQFALEKMSHLYWRDEQGNMWPYWAGFKLRMLSGSTARAKPVPAWLSQICTATFEDKNAGQAVGESLEGARCSFRQLLLIVEEIRKWCLDNNAEMPAIEALPITIGTQDEKQRETARKEKKRAEQLCNRADEKLRRLTGSNASGTITQRAHEEFVSAHNVFKMTQEAVRLADVDARSTCSTVPNKREARSIAQAKASAREGEARSSVGQAPRSKGEGQGFCKRSLPGNPDSEHPCKRKNTRYDVQGAETELGFG